MGHIVTLLPLVTGCSKTRSVSLADEPDAARGRRGISVYTDRGGTEHEWRGQVRPAGAYSLQFTRLGGDPLAYGPREKVTMRLAREPGDGHDSVPRAPRLLRAWLSGPGSSASRPST